MTFRADLNHLWLLLAAVVLLGCPKDAAEAGPESPDTGWVVADIPDTASPEPDGSWPEPDVADAGVPDPGKPTPTVFVTELQPPSGHTQGSETIQVVGFGFSHGALVLFDGVPSPWVVFVDETRLHAFSPAHSPDVVTITVISGGETAQLEDSFTYFNDIEVTAVSPDFGPSTGGGPITVSGRGFEPDSVLIVGPHKAIDTQVLNDHTLLALAPPGSAGRVDVAVANSRGVARLSKGYRYQAGVAVDAVLPGAGPVAGGQTVELLGSGFVAPVSVWLDQAAASVVEVQEDGKRVVIVTPPGQGIVDVRVDSVEGTVVALDAYRYGPVSDGPAVLHMAPGHGPVAGGNSVTLTVGGLVLSETPLVSFGAGGATVTHMTADSLVVEAPPGPGAGAVTVTIATTPTLTTSYTYVILPQIESVSPSVGPVDGGDSVTLSGPGVVGAQAVWIGALQAQITATEGSDELQLTTPPGSPGMADVRAMIDGQPVVLEQAYEFVPETPELYVVLPDHGSIAGGTWIQLIGAGFPTEPAVLVGGQPATDVLRISGSYITARTPPGSISTLAVSVGDTSLEGAFTYYDPATFLGGTWGDALDGSVNLTVFDGTDASPVADAFVLLDNDPSTPYQGFTNAAGQLTFSGPGLEGAHTIGISKEAYVTYSVVHFNAENVTVYLKRVSEPEPEMPDGVLPSFAAGKVKGLGKYVAGVAGQCVHQPDQDPVHCMPCVDTADCGDGLAAQCTNLGAVQGWRCLKHCEDVEADCPEKHQCQSSIAQSICMPTPGPKVAICSGTKPYYRMFDVPLGDAAMATEDGDFTIITFPTEIAVVCFGGFWIGSGEPTSAKLEDAIKGDPSSNFLPVAMGVARHLLMEPGSVVAGLEIELDIKLDRTVHARLDKPPMEDVNYLWATTYLDFGTDGAIRMPVQGIKYQDEPFLLGSLPSSFSPPSLAEASFIFYAGARAWSYPRAYVVRQGITEPMDDRMLQLVDGTWGTAPTGLVESLRGAVGFGDNNIITVGTGGAAYRFDGSQHLLMPTPTQKTLRDVHGAAADDVWAVGDDGMALHFDGAAWTQEGLGISADLEGVRAEDDGTVWVIAPYTVRRRSPAGVWTDAAAPAKWWLGIDGTGPTDVWLSARAGQAAHYDGSDWTSVALPTSRDLHAVACEAPVDVWMGGDGGELVHWDGVTWTAEQAPSDDAILDLASRGPNEVVAVGQYGAVHIYDGAAWVKVPTGDYVQDLHAVVLPTATSNARTFGDHQLILGPVVAPARITSPMAGQAFAGDTISWTADPRVPAHYQTVEILVPGMFSPTLIWEMIADGDVGSALVPDFAALQGTPGLQSGLHYLQVMRAHQEGFDIDGFDNTQLGSKDRQSWAIEFISFDVPEAAP
ncbi:MAG: hypothetical protein ACI9WU_003287 [Myxococcota bacterium]|jgi:hypothetical protein